MILFVSLNINRVESKYNSFHIYWNRPVDINKCDPIKSLKRNRLQITRLSVSESWTDWTWSWTNWCWRFRPARVWCDDHYEDEQQMSWLPTSPSLPCEVERGHSDSLTVRRVLTGRGGCMAGTHSVAAQSSSLQDGQHQVRTLWAT